MSQTTIQTIKTIKDNSCWYIHNGDEGILTYGLEIGQEGNNLDFFAFDQLSESQLKMIMDDPTIAYECYTQWATNGEEVDYTLVVNCQNDERLAYGWVTTEHAILDEWERDYNTIAKMFVTGHHWTSRAYYYKERIQEAEENQKEKIYKEYTKEAEKAKMEGYDYPELLSLDDFQF